MNINKEDIGKQIKIILKERRDLAGELLEIGNNSMKVGIIYRPVPWRSFNVEKNLSYGLISNYEVIGACELSRDKFDKQDIGRCVEVYFNPKKHKLAKFLGATRVSSLGRLTGIYNDHIKLTDDFSMSYVGRTFEGIELTPSEIKQLSCWINGARKIPYDQILYFLRE
ncbi:hypothetical protein J4468_00795 [Candidatus Woesearchaeota archaeon]|nr:hypothetical protein [Candidatus Woesearchaeota archaeon]